MKNYIDSQEHWEDSVNTKYDRIEQMNRDIEKEINNEIQEQIRGQTLSGVSDSYCTLHSEIKKCDWVKKNKHACKGCAYKVQV
jgi:hypothetical protein